MTVVDTETTVETTEPESTDDTTTVVVDTGDDNNDLEIGVALGVLTTTVNELATVVTAQGERLSSLEMAQQATAQVAEAAIETAIDTEVTVEEALAEVEEVAEEEAAETVEEMIEPVREHPLWRKPIRLRRNQIDA